MTEETYKEAHKLSEAMNEELNNIYMIEHLLCSGQLEVQVKYFYRSGESRANIRCSQERIIDFLYAVKEESQRDYNEAKAKRESL